MSRPNPSPSGDGGSVWAVQAGEGPAQSDKGYAIEVLEDGTSYVVGHHTGEPMFGEGDPNETVLEYLGGQDAFLARYAADGTLSWVVNAGGPDEDLATDLTIGNDGSIFVTGFFSETVVFGHHESNETTLVSGGERDIFIARYSSDGNLIWAQQAGGPYKITNMSPVANWHITTLPDGTVVVSGGFMNEITFAPGESEETTLFAVGESDIYLARFAEDGTLLWAERAGGDVMSPYSPTVTVGNVCSMEDGSFVLTGHFKETAVFDEGEPTEQSVSSDGRDCFFARYSAEGVLQWLTSTTGSRSAFCRDIAAFGAGSSVVIGDFTDDVLLGPGETNETGFEATSQDMFIAMLGPTGELLWARQIEGPEEDWQFVSGLGVETTTEGTATVTGYFDDVIVLGADEPGEIKIESAGRTDVIVARYLSDGTLDTAWRAGSPVDGFMGGDRGHDVAVTSDGSTFVTGDFTSTATFGAGGDNVVQLTSYGNSDMFVARYAP